MTYWNLGMHVSTLQRLSNQATCSIYLYVSFMKPLWTHRPNISSTTCRLASHSFWCGTPALSHEAPTRLSPTDCDRSTSVMLLY